MESASQHVRQKATDAYQTSSIAPFGAVRAQSKTRQEGQSEGSPALWFHRLGQGAGPPRLACRSDVARVGDRQVASAFFAGGISATAGTGQTGPEERQFSAIECRHIVTGRTPTHLHRHRRHFGVIWSQRPNGHAN